MHVAGQHHRVAHPGGGPRRGEPRARGRVAVPRVHRDRVGGARVVVATAEEHLLPDHVPRRPRAPEPVGQPRLLGRARQRPRRVGGVRAVLVAVAAGLVVAELPGVEHVERRQPAPLHPPVELHRRPVRHRGAPQRHVLVVGAVRRGPALGEARHGGGVLGDQPGVVVVDLVVVPDHQPRRGGVRGLQVGVGLVLREPLPVVGQRHRLRPDVRAAERVGGGGALVLVVAEVQHQVGPLRREVPVRREVAGRVVRAGRERHGQGGTRAPGAGAVIERPTGDW